MQKLKMNTKMNIQTDVETSVKANERFWICYHQNTSMINAKIKNEYKSKYVQANRDKRKG